ncbi:MAG: type 1 glutamine amidotransferase [Candidatus Omnitrophica bacterium]|nr:type 1 glutamine amidotransferase [Candidatus Omnitrophota bacterium]
MILFIKNIDIEGPETLGLFFISKGYAIEIFDLSRGDALPQDLSGFDAVIVLGGAMNVYEEEKHSFLKAEDELIRKVLFQKIPFLGLCLGSQLLAKACGAQVVPSPRKEVGFSKITLTPEGQRDELFEGLPKSIEVFQWHEDMFQLCPQATLLAQAEACPHQAFRVGPNAYGLQFHVEITPESIESWSRTYLGDEERVYMAKTQKMLYDYRNIKDRFDHYAQIIYGNFLNIILDAKQNSL